MFTKNLFWGVGGSIPSKGKSKIPSLNPPEWAQKWYNNIRGKKNLDILQPEYNWVYPTHIVFCLAEIAFSIYFRAKNVIFPYIIKTKKGSLHCLLKWFFGGKKFAQP